MQITFFSQIRHSDGVLYGVALYYFDRLKWASLWELLEVRIVGAFLSDPDSSAWNKSDKPNNTKRNVF